jgi:hypothetical protein
MVSGSVRFVVEIDVIDVVFEVDSMLFDGLPKCRFLFLS